MPTSRPLSLIHVVDSLEFGGLERVVTDLAIEQHRQGHRVCVFSINRALGLADELANAGVVVLSGNKSKPFDLGVLSALRRSAVGQNADVVHAHNFSPNYYAACALFGMVNRPTLVGTCHDMGTRLSNRRLRWIYRASLTQTARLAMVGQQVFDRYIALNMVPADRATTVLNGIPVDRFQNSAPRRHAARTTLGLTETDLVIGCVGRLVGLKNHGLLMSILPRLAARFPALRVVIVGYGELEAPLKAQAQALGVADRLLITGQRSDVSDLLPAFDIFALPSKTEGLSIALLEACATSLPVVASAVGGNPEIIHHQQTGLLVPVDDAQALEEAMLQLISSSELRARLGSAANDWVRQNASITALQQAYEGFYTTAMKR